MRKRIRPLPEIADLKQYLLYNPETGSLTWRYRQNDTSGFNVRLAGREAGTLQNCGYRSIKFRYGQALVHRIVWAIHHGEWPGGELDHRDGDKLNNRIDNLRIASRCANVVNRPANASSRTQVKGVTPRRGRYVAQIVIAGQKFWLGTYDTVEEARRAYNRAAEAMHGEYAYHRRPIIGKLHGRIMITSVQ